MDECENLVYLLYFEDMGLNVGISFIRYHSPSDIGLPALTNPCF